MTLPDWIIHAVNFVVAPLLGWNWLLHRKQSKQDTDIAVLQTQVGFHKEQYRQIMGKLDDIEAALRSKD
ncbi:hypothetical protein Q5Y75_05620 [Ruegeria sp. 2205SS24-7]|uniref:hypothetical protein n=1 Tax=Ruegeria discodermiae TaxID=3064389 RepID=UPI0027418BF9|nr:hypothetical protein [Ruegeria sp. 2205SS24-7]MDP5216689.1 hypothetical protein [Ruegeria sp. 2205SS24-7]